MTGLPVFTLRFRPVRPWGAFVEIAWQWTALERREAGEAPEGSAGSGSLVLVETEEAWWVAASTASIT
ncbi:MAG: hypothetical protein KY453_12880 [Gemmatimonadetes bacterium]|nr:hypothetical protein [Gemmatimonadota bacterium]